MKILIFCIEMFYAFKCIEQGLKINFIAYLQWSLSMDSIESYCL
jgi:hypothetical protein